MVDKLQFTRDAPAKLDLEKYGLSYLPKNDVKTWNKSDIEQLLDAFTNESIAPAIDGLLFNQYNIKELLSRSHCRRCGKCCLPDPLDPDDPGVMVFEKELRSIAKSSSFSYKHLKKKTKPYRWDSRRLPLPCPFYQKTGCKIYNKRPFVCTIYPLTDAPSPNGRIYISINVRCDYGKDLYKSIIDNIKSGTIAPLIADRDLLLT